MVALPPFDPRVLLFVFLPPLLFDAAFRLDERELRSAAGWAYFWPPAGHS